MRLLLLSLCAVATLGQHEKQQDARYAGYYPDRHYPDRHYPGRHYPDRYYPHPGSGNPYVPPSGCKNWCRRDTFLPGRQQYYCCDHSGPIVYPRPRYPYPPTHQKICPASPPTCNRVFSALAAPTECYSDSECSTSDRCCYDVCLRHKTCKTADYVDRRRRPRPRPRPVPILPGIIGSLFGRSAFDEAHDVAAGDGVAFRSATTADEPAALKGEKVTKEVKHE